MHVVNFIVAVVVDVSTTCSCDIRVIEFVHAAEFDAPYGNVRSKLWLYDHILTLQYRFGAAMVCNAIARFFLCICAYHDDRGGYDDVGVNTELTWQIGRESESYADLGGYSEDIHSSSVSESSHHFRIFVAS
jgi:hypothetical protein